MSVQNHLIANMVLCGPKWLGELHSEWIIKSQVKLQTRMVTLGSRYRISPLETATYGRHLLERHWNSSALLFLVADERSAKRSPISLLSHTGGSHSYCVCVSEREGGGERETVCVQVTGIPPLVPFTQVSKSRLVSPRHNAPVTTKGDTLKQNTVISTEHNNTEYQTSLSICLI